MRAVGIALVALVFGLPARAVANEVHLTLSAGTDFPLDIGGALALELPWRIEVSGGVGVLPGAYVDAANAALVSANAYDQTTATLVREALQNSVVWRTHLGWRPFAHAGFFFQVGYGVAVLNAGLTAGQISDATGVGMPYEMSPSAKVQLHTAIQMADLELGWRWLFGKHVVLRTALGAIHAFASRSQIQTSGAGTLQPLIETFEKPGALQIDQKVTTYGNSFELTLSVGFRPF